MNIFNKIQVKRPDTNTFDLSYDHKLSLKMGQLTPIHVQECIPGDKFTMSSETLLRFAPLISPVMHKVDVYTHFFYVPSRVIWKNFPDFIVNNKELALPYFQGTELDPLPVTVGSIADYMGLPITENMDQRINALPFLAYAKIYTDYYIDQNNDPLYQTLKDFIDNIPDGKQTDPIALQMFYGTPAKRAWEHDYFTSCLPFAQKGEAVNIPLSLSGTAPISGTLDTDQVLDENGDPIVSESPMQTGPNGELQVDGVNAQLNKSLWEADLNGAGELSGTINDLRRAFSLQKWLEKNARAGTRYIESLLAHFGVRSSDKRLQRAEYLGGSKSPVVISEVLQTSQTDAEVTPQANMAGHAVSVNSGRDFSYYCEEHGYIIGVMSVMPKTAYQQGIPRMFSKLQNLDFYWPDFAQIGEQEVLNKEIYFETGDADNDETFGYLPRYAEYRFNPSRVSGQFRDTLDFWHLGRIFENRPQLNDEFIYCDPEETKRIFAVTDEESEDLYCHIFIRNIARRPLPLYGTPAGL